MKKHLKTFRTRFFTFKNIDKCVENREIIFIRGFLCLQNTGLSVGYTVFCDVKILEYRVNKHVRQNEKILFFCKKF
jgi:hypothetical protein